MFCTRAQERHGGELPASGSPAVETLTSAWEQEGQARAALADKCVIMGPGCRMLWSRVPSPSCWLQGDASLGNGAMVLKEGARYPQQQDEQFPWDISSRSHLLPPFRHKGLYLLQSPGVLFKVLMLQNWIFFLSI